MSCQARSNRSKHQPIQRQGLSPHFQTSKFGKPNGQDYNRRGAPCPQWRAKTDVFDDPCSVAVRERQSIDTGDYQVTNFFRKCGEPVMTSCSLDQVLTYPTVWGNTPQCKVDQDTLFKYPPLTNLKNVQQLYTRPYVSQGYRGAGANNLHMKDLESALLQGNSMTTHKGCENSNEVYIDRFDYLPKYGDPQRIDRTVEPWTRGGILTTELVRRLSYEDYCHLLNKAKPF